MRLRILLVLVSLVAASNAESVFKKTPAQAAYLDGVTHLSKGRVDEAEKAFRKSLQIEAAQAGSYIGLADVAIRRNRLEEADQLFQKALAMEPRNAGAHGARGRFLASQARHQEALAALNRSLELQPGAVSVRVDLGDLYLKGFKQPDRAIALYREAIDRKYDHAGAHYALGHAYRQKGDFPLAKKEWREAARLAPANPLPIHSLGEMQLAEKDFKGALATFTQALQISPKFFPSLVARGEIYTTWGDFTKAHEDFKLAADLQPSNAAVLAKLGTALQGLKRKSDARAVYQKALSLDKKNLTALNNLAMLCAEDKQDLDSALAWATSAVEIRPASGRLRDTLAWVHRARGDRQKALTESRKAIQGEHATAITAYHLGVLEQESGNSSQAKAALQKALTMEKDFPGSDDARARLAKL